MRAMDTTSVNVSDMDKRSEQHFLMSPAEFGSMQVEPEITRNLSERVGALMDLGCLRDEDAEALRTALHTERTDRPSFF